MESQQLIPFDPNNIVAFDDFRSQLAELRRLNETVVFNYRDRKGNKEARSHIHKLRKSKSALEAARKEAKAAALQYGRAVDEKANELKSEVEAMIDQHQEPLEQIEREEAERQAKLERRMAAINIIDSIPHDADSEYLAHWIGQLESITIDDSWEEYQEQAEARLAENLETLRKRHADQVQLEKDQEELERHRREAAERQEAEERARKAKEAAEQAEREKKEREEREARIRQEAEERAAKEIAEAEEKVIASLEDIREKVMDPAVTSERIEALQEAIATYLMPKATWPRHKEISEQRDTLAALVRTRLADVLQAEASAKEKAEEEARLQAERAAQHEAEERKKAIAETKAKAEKEAREAAEREQQEKAAAEEKARQKREANKRHLAKINNAAKDALQAILDERHPEETAQAIVEAIAKGNIPHVSIEY